MSTTEGARWVLHFFGDCRVPARTELADRLGTILCPTAIVWGTGDDYLRLTIAEELATRIPAAELTLIAGAGHFVMEKAPDAALAALRRLLARDGGSSTPPTPSTTHARIRFVIPTIIRRRATTEPTTHRDTAKERSHSHEHGERADDQSRDTVRDLTERQPDEEDADQDQVPPARATRSTTARPGGQPPDAARDRQPTLDEKQGREREHEQGQRGAPGLAHAPEEWHRRWWRASGPS
jgi:hypothetical protein